VSRSCSWASLHKIADKGRPSVEQIIKTVFLTETSIVVVSNRESFLPILKRDGRLHSNQSIHFITSLITDRIS
jgi:hypothetical protein